jgi:hypothetical protein
LSPEPDIDRYQRSFAYRCWIDLWFFFRAPTRAQLPLNWVTRSEWTRLSRKRLAGIVRAMLRR